MGEGRVADGEGCRRKAEELLKQSLAAQGLHERGQLLHQAVYWHDKAIEAAQRPGPRIEDHTVILDPDPSDPGSA